MFYGLGFNPNTGFQNSFWSEETGYEAKDEADHPIGRPENGGSEAVFVKFDLVILEMGHLVAHRGDKLAVQFGGFFSELEFVYADCHSFEGVKGLKGFFESFQLL